MIPACSKTIADGKYSQWCSAACTKKGCKQQYNKLAHLKSELLASLSTALICVESAHCLIRLLRHWLLSMLQRTSCVAEHALHNRRARARRRRLLKNSRGVGCAFLKLKCGRSEFSVLTRVIMELSQHAWFGGPEFFMGGSTTSSSAHCHTQPMNKRVKIGSIKTE